MPPNTLLDTNTVNTSELLGNGKVYRVPPFQHDYSWTEEHWEDLWNDIQAIRRGEERKHYMGTVVLQAKTDKDYLIIDGQQRFTTMSLIAIAVIKRLDELVIAGLDPDANRERASILRRTYLGDKEPKNLLYSSKLFLNSNNDPFYQGYVLQHREPPNPHRLSATDKLLWQAYQYFYRRIGELDELRDSGQRLAAFLTEDVGEKLLFIQILVQDELSAYTVFETLNARGVELTATDLLKNYMFSLIPTADLSHVQHQWKRIADLVGTDKLPEFLRHVINSRQSLVRAQRLFRAIKDTVASGPAALAPLDELEKEADVYSAVFDAAHDRWRENKEARRLVRVLRLFHVKQLAPLMLAAHRRFSLDDFVRVLKLSVVISFRYSVVGRNNPNELERIYNQAAVDIHNGDVTTPRQVFERLRAVYVSDEAFRRDFMYASIPTARRKKLVRYILCELEIDAGGSPGLDFEDDSATIEHVLPESPAAAWLSTFPPGVHEVFVYRLGNYSLLEASFNREVENKTFPEKKPVYAKSRYQLTRSITGEEWTTERITLRQEQLAARAAHVWRSDYT